MSKARRVVLGVTGIRSEYFLQRPIFHAIERHPELELRLVVTGAHLSPLHGRTVETVEADGFTIHSRIENLLYSSRDAARLKGAALQLQQLAHVIDELRPDWILAPADREEALTAATCGSYMNIAVAHYAAGDRVVGNVDDMVRHAVSRLSHLLLATSEQSKERLIRTGEQPWRVHNVGHAGLDRMRETAEMDRRALAQRLGVERIEDEYVVVVQHPISSDIDRSGADMEETLAAVAESGRQAFVSYPNSDPGSHEIVAAIEAAAARDPRVHVFRTIPDDAFVNLLRGAGVLLGNSSMGVLEAPFLGLPAINVGARQSQREHGENIVFVKAERRAIRDAMNRVLEDGETRTRMAKPDMRFGDGRTGERVAALLAETPLDARLYDKDLTS